MTTLHKFVLDVVIQRALETKQMLHFCINFSRPLCSLEKNRGIKTKKRHDAYCSVGHLVARVNAKENAGVIDKCAIRDITVITHSGYMSTTLAS